MWKMLTTQWWPHPLHGVLRYAFTDECVVFTCPCGDRLVVTHAAAQEMGLI